jgi:hypothetical protein
MLTTNPSRPRIFRLRTDDPEKAIDDPALALLASAGWTAVASFPAEERKGADLHRFVVIVLWPPPADRAPQGWISRVGSAARWIVILLALSVEAGIALTILAILVAVIASQLA